jgi:hypothetical protein
MYELLKKLGNKKRIIKYLYLVSEAAKSKAEKENKKSH